LCFQTKLLNIPSAYFVLEFQPAELVPLPYNAGVEVKAGNLQEKLGSFGRSRHGTELGPRLGHIKQEGRMPIGHSDE